jgi:hypothetical protein
MTRNALLGLMATLLAASPAAAGIEQAGTSAANFLAVGAGPAVLGMGGAALGRSGSLDLAAWNPGALGYVEETSLQLAHSSLDDQTMQEWATLGGRFGHSSTHWAISALYQNEGAIEGRDASNFATETFNVGSGAGMLQLAQAFGPHVAVGVTGKYVLDNLGPSQTGSGMTFDGGMSLRFGLLGFGFAAQNVGGQMKYGSLSYPFPSSYGAGVSFTHAASGLTAACDVNVPSTSYTDVRTGVEWNWKQHVALRAGYRMEMNAPSDEPLSGPAFGTGLGGHGLWLDYGFVLSGNEGGQHRLAISLRPKGMNWKAGDPFGQSSMPREFDPPTPTRQIGPPAPAGDAKQTKK